MGKSVILSTDDGVATVRLDRPPVNALGLEMWRELGEAADECAADDGIRAVVLWGGPEVFAGGADVKEMADVELQEMLPRATVLQEALRALERLPKVVIAAITGYALGGGCELAMAADFRYAAEDAQLGQPEIRLGLLPGGGGTQRLARLVGVQNAKRLIYSGDMLAAPAALEMGLVDKVIGPERVYDEAVAAARGYAEGPYALGLAKRAIDEGLSMDLDAALRLESTLFAAAFATEDARSGMRAFVDKAAGGPRFVGR